MKYQVGDVADLRVIYACVHFIQNGGQLESLHGTLPVGQDSALGDLMFVMHP